MKIKIRHGGMLKCGFPGCKAHFVSYSMISLLRTQAVAAGWGRVKPWQLTGTMEDGSKPLVDVCPDHNMVAKANLARRDDIVAADRAKKKAEREAKKAEKSAAWAAKTAAWAAKRTAKAEAKAARDKERAERAQQRAEAATARSERAAARATERLTKAANKRKRKAAGDPVTAPADPPPRQLDAHLEDA